MDGFEPAIRLFWEGRWPLGMIERRRRLYDCELVYVSAGRFTLYLDGRPQALKKGMLAIIPPAFWHESRVEQGRGTTRQCVHFDWVPDFVSRHVPLFAAEGDRFNERLVHPVPVAVASRLPLIASAATLAPMADILGQMLARSRRSDHTAELLLWPILRFLLARSASSAPPRSGGKPARAAMAAKQYLDLHYREAIGYPELCDVTGLTENHLCSLFHRIVGQPPLAYLTGLRLAHACRMLREESCNVSEVAYAVGFSSPNYFARVFRARHGCTPSQYMAAREG